MSMSNKKDNSSVKIYTTNEYENKDKNIDYQTSISQTTNNLKEEEELENKDYFNDDYKHSINVKSLDKFKDFDFKYKDKIKFMEKYIIKYIIPIIKDIFKFFKKILNSTNKKFSIDDYSFNFLKKKMFIKLKAINRFFEIFDFIKKN